MKWGTKVDRTSGAMVQRGDGIVGQNEEHRPWTRITKQAAKQARPETNTRQIQIRAGHTTKNRPIEPVN